MTAYYAVPDPNDPGQMTYWRRDHRGRLTPWPSKARYGPTLNRSDVPDGLTPTDRHQWITDWFRTHRRPWDDAVRAALDADPAQAQAAFAAFAVRCCVCGRRLTDAKSKTVGVGPDCRDGFGEDVLADLAVRVGRAHAAALDAEVSR